jgi:hypothetical protein
MVVITPKVLRAAPPNRFSMSSLRLNTGFCARNTLPMNPVRKLSSTEIHERLQHKG